MSKSKENTTSEYKYTRRKISFISFFVTAILILCTMVMNIVIQPMVNVLRYVDKNMPIVTEKIKNLSLDSDILENLRVVEAEYSFLIEVILPDGSLSYSSLDDKIYLNDSSAKNVKDKSILSKKPIEKNVTNSTEFDRNIFSIFGYKMLKADNGEKIYKLKENIEVNNKVFPAGSRMTIYFSDMEFYNSLMWWGIMRTLINTLVLIIIWLVFNSIIIGLYTKIIKMNSVVKKVKEGDFSSKCKAYKGEIGHLAENINGLADNYEKDLRTSEAENERIQAELDAAFKMESEKKDFLANAAHELKTPIAIIQGYAEGLKMGIAKGGRARQEYCNIIMEETNKMNKLVLELLELSKYRQKMYEDVKEENFSIRSFVQGIINSMDPILKENSIDIENTINRKYIGRTDLEKTNLVLSNYISNAISHTNLYKKIVISCEERATTYRINVFNSGDHISEENMKNIWDSFYRVDKSHSRSEGRFGIGLSIVENIQSALKMDYGVENVYGGVQFWFDVKKATSEDKK